MLPGAGASLATILSDTLNGSTQVAFPDGIWVSEYVASAFTLTGVDVSVWETEPSSTSNCGGRFRVFKRTLAGTETELGGPYDLGSELVFPTSTYREDAWVGDVPDTSFAVNDRIVVKFYVTNVGGTMGSSGQCRMRYNAADGTQGDSWLNIAETVTFSSTPINDPPTISPNTADEHDYGSDTTPTLEFTGTDPESDDLRYNVQIDAASTFDSIVGSTVLDSYSESNQSSEISLDSSALIKAGQSFNVPSNSILTQAQFYLMKVGSPTGSAHAALYAHSGTFGTSSVGTGSALATSEEFDVSALTGSYQLVTFNFEDHELAPENYVILLEYSGGDGSNRVRVGADISGPTHAGNAVRFGTGWEAVGGTDCCFYIYKVTGLPLLDKLSGTDLGFANTVTGGDTDPFNSGEKVSFTVQAGDALTSGLYYWRARAKDPTGSNQYSAWSAIRSFVINAALLVFGVQSVGNVQSSVDLSADPPSSYQVLNESPETVDSVVTTKLMSRTAEGEVPQQHAIIESHGGGDSGVVAIPPGVEVSSDTDVAGADTDVTLYGTEG